MTRPDALERAYAKDWQRASLMRMLASQRIDPAVIVMWPPGFAMTMRTLSILEAAAGMGHHRAEAVLRASGVDEAAELRQLSQRDRIRIVQTLRANHPQLWQLRPSPNQEVPT